MRELRQKLSNSALTIFAGVLIHRRAMLSGQRAPPRQRQGYRQAMLTPADVDTSTTSFTCDGISASQQPLLAAFQLAQKMIDIHYLMPPIICRCKMIFRLFLRSRFEYYDDADRDFDDSATVAIEKGQRQSTKRQIPPRPRPASSYLQPFYAFTISKSRCVISGAPPRRQALFISPVCRARAGPSAATTSHQYHADKAFTLYRFTECVKPPV